jgi:putative oxidoreductase
MNIVLWILQILLAAIFLFNGINHFSVPPGLPEQMAWMYDLSPALHTFIGTFEVLGALGLVLPGLTRTQTRLTPLAALGLVIVMLGAAVWHIPRGEALNSVINLVIAGMAGFVAYGRWRLSPFKERK